jgi:putative transcriptional regulator
MKREKQVRGYRSEIAEAVHEMIAGIHDAGLIDEQTMRAFDASCLVAAASLALDSGRTFRRPCWRKPVLMAVRSQGPTVIYGFY